MYHNIIEMVIIMHIFQIIVKTFFIYALVALIFRIMGKREVGQLGTFDLVVFILIAELVAISIENKNNFFLNLIPVLILVFLQVVISKLSLKSVKFRKIVDGIPTIIIKKGVIDFKNMVEQRYSLDDLLLQLREKDVSDISEVDYAILEINGKLSVFKKKDNKNNTFPLPIIVDGKVNFDNLYSIKKSNNWLLNTLFSRNIKVEDVFYSFYQNNELYIIKNNDIKN